MSESNQADHSVLEEHYTRFVGELGEMVFCSDEASATPIDIHLCAPTRGRAYWTYITAGMSDYEMNIPPALKDLFSARVELIAYSEVFHAWIPGMLKTLVDSIFANKSFIGYGYNALFEHGLPITRGDRLFNSVYFTLPANEMSEFAQLTVCGNTVSLMAIVPITGRERRYALEFSVKDLDDKLADANVSFLLDERRDSVA